MSNVLNKPRARKEQRAEAQHFIDTLQGTVLSQLTPDLSCRLSRNDLQRADARNPA
jgi:hypothetical protein